MAEWIEMFRINAILFDFVSPLAMAEWIEICGFLRFLPGLECLR